MRLRTLRLQNYRRFQDAFLELPEGVVAIVGPNGAGKSTLLEAVSWCLYGNEAARTSKDLLKRTAAAPGDDAGVTLEFELDGQAWAVTRRMRGRSQQSEAQVTIDGTLVVAPGANSAEAATERVTRALGMDRRGFLATVLARQGDLDALSQSAPGERKKLLLGLLGVSAVETAISLCRAEKREAEIRLEETRSRLERLGPIKQRLEAAVTENADVENRLVRAQTELNQARDSCAAAERTEQVWAGIRARHRDLRAQLDGLHRALQGREEQRNRLGAELQLLDVKATELARLRFEGDRFAALDGELARLDEHREALRRRAPSEAERQSLVRERERWNATLARNGNEAGDLETLARRVQELRANLVDQTARLAQEAARASHLQEERRRIQQESLEESERWRELRDLGADAACPLCGRAMGDAHSRIMQKAAREESRVRQRASALSQEVTAAVELEGRLRNQRETTQRELAREEAAWEALRRHVAGVEQATLEVARLDSRIAALDSELAALPAPPPPGPDAQELGRLRQERDRWSQAVARLEAELQRTARVRSELAALSPQVEGLRKEIESATRELADLSYSDGRWEAAQRVAAQARELKHESQRRLDVLQERRRSLAGLVNQLRADVAALETDEKVVEGLVERVRVGEALAGDRGDSGLLPEFRNHLIARARPALARSAGALLAQMTEGRYTELSLDEDFTLRLYDGSNAWPIQRFSGGESDVVHLAVRLAVGELLVRARDASRLQFVALDEVLASQDDDRRRSVLGSLKTLGTFFRQVFVVTHLGEIRERVDHVIRVVPAPDGTSQVLAVADEA